METPASMRRVTRSMASATSKNIPTSRGKKNESEKAFSRSMKAERLALVDISNDSPIVGLAMGALNTPASLAKYSARVKQTPGSGEALLRGQVKTLLQQIEEDGVEFLKLPSLDLRPPALFQGLTQSPALRFLAPTPANTPLAANLSVGEAPLVANLSDGEVINVKREEVPQSAQKSDTDLKQEITVVDSPESLITRALLFDSPGKSDISSSSVVSSEITYVGSPKSGDEDSSSVWSIQANASSNDEYNHEIEYDEGEISAEFYEEEGAEEDCGDVIDELCDGLSNICMQEKRLPEFTGRHTRFSYNSDDEIEGEEEMGLSISPSILRLKGMPKPKGKHLRFPEDESSS